MSIYRSLCLSAVFLISAISITAQDEPDLLNLYPDNVIPMARFGWGVPYDAEYMPDSEQVAIATGAGVTFYDHRLYEVQYIDTRGHIPKIIAISPDGKLLATGDDDVYLWDIETGDNIDILPTGLGISDISFNADGSLIAVSKSWASVNNTTGIYIFETATGRQQKHLDFEHGAVFQQVEFASDGQHLFVIDCCHAGNLFKIDIETLNLQHVINSEGFLVSPDSNQIISFTWGWDIIDSNADNLIDLEVHASHESRYVLDMSPINDNGSFSGVLENGDYGRWDGNSLELVTFGSLGFKPQIAALSRDGTWLTAIGRDGEIVTLNIDTNEQVIQSYIYAKSDAFAIWGDRVFFVTNTQQLAWWNIWTWEYGLLDEQPVTIQTLIASSDAWLYSVNDDEIIERWSPFGKEGAHTPLFEQPNTQIVSMAYHENDDLYVAVCELGEGKLLRLDSETGESLGFYPNYESSVPTLPEIDLPNCYTQVMTLGKNVRYMSGATIYEFDGLHANYISNTQTPFEYPELYVDNNRQILVHKSTAFRWDGSTVILVASHAYEITALASVDNVGLYVSAACREHQYGSGGDFWCYGVDMAITNWDEKRASLIGHTDIVRHIIRHSRLPAFVSLSEDGTIILWGSPIQPEPLRRVGVFGLVSN